MNCCFFQVRESYFEEMISKLDFSALSNNSLEADLGGTHQLCKDMFIFSIVSLACTMKYFLKGLKFLLSLLFLVFLSGMDLKHTVLKLREILEQTMEYAVGIHLNLISQKFSNTVGPKVCQSQIGDIGLLKSKR